MANVILDARQTLRQTKVRITSVESWAAEHARRTKRWGIRPQTVETPVVARIEHGRWLFDCDCGSGVAVHPDWPRAYCLGEDCGRMYTNVQIPANRAAIETELLKRPAERTRNWIPGETVTDLKRQRAEAERVRGAVQP